MVKILAVNAGSSTLKWKLFAMPEERVIARGLVDNLGLPGTTFTVKYGDGQQLVEEEDIQSVDVAVDKLIHELKHLHIIEDYHEIGGVGHRVVAGGETFKASSVIGPKELDQIEALSELAPLHNPPEAKGIRAFMQVLPDTPEVGVFDTAYHTTIPEMNYLYSIPMQYYRDFGLRKYGAHGTSIRYVVTHTAKMLHKPMSELNLIVMHMGSGVSVTAVRNGASYDTSMGYTPVSGVTMSTRSGDVDPSLVAMLMKKLQLTDPDDVIKILNTESGVFGISELSPDMRKVEETRTTRHQSQLAIDIFVNRMVKYVAGYIAELGHVDGLVFTAGMGEGDGAMRQRIIDGLRVFGVRMHEDRNNDVRPEDTDLTANGSTMKVLLLPTDEELMIARDVMELTK